ncbi:lytic transglycosylase domain-containing protein [Burkholderia ubonensis]|uniref:lytic transglycosylase domain-containing protein n=1 Tax=Burkholderia ubonensis TaxID=101571 RepID=UPI000AA4827A|nr:lytic transglycosylase domain-containing protein [Burkholderia ubonensis]
MASPQNQPAAPQNNPTKASEAPSLTWHYPFSAKDGKEITDPQIFYCALGAMSDGFFPLGVNGFPHGGVHFGAASASRFDQSKGVQAIADGEIVAFKIDDAYPHLRYTQTRRWAWYSTGFVLVRHKLTMPRAPGSSGAQPADETLTFFSLYMHMADWSTYLSDGKLVRPGWWPGVDAFRIGAKDRQLGGGTSGAFVFTAPTAGKKKNQFSPGQHVGFLPEGSEVTISETRGRSNEWGHIKAITSGHMISPTSGGVFGSDDLNVPWVRPDGDESGKAPVTPEGDYGWIYLHDQQAVKEPNGVGTVVIPSQPIHVNAGTLLGQLGEYIDYETSTPLPPIPSRQLLHLEVFAGEALKTFIEKSRTRAAQLPPSDRTVFVIQAGAKFVAKPTDADLSLGSGVQLAKLTLTSASPKTGPWIQVQPWIKDASGKAQLYQGPVWIARSGLSRLDSPTGLSAWKSFPLQLSQAGSPTNADLVTYPSTELNALGDGNVATDDKGVTWWRLEVGTGSGQAAMGWVCGGKQSDRSGNHPGTRWESPWAWPGFEIVDATGINLADAFKRNLAVTGSANATEQKAFAPSIEAVGNSALLSKLEQTVSRLPSVSGAKDDQGKGGGLIVTAVKLRQALGRRWLASDLGHVILKYESEWGGSTSRWDALTPLMRNAAENWRCELERIKKLQWWDLVKGKVDGLPSSPVVNHIHPIAMIGNFSGACPAACQTKIVEFATSEGPFRISERSFQFILSIESYKNRPYVPAGDQSSGVTVGYGYDLGQQSVATIVTDLNGIFSPAQITRLQQASGVHGDAARHLVPSFSDIEVTMDMALRLAVVMKRRYAQQTVDAFPGVTKTHPHCQGALLSLVINRGPGMVDKLHQKSREHMRAIRADFQGGSIQDVPVQLRRMKSLWEGGGQGGLVDRREKEAVLFEAGMNCNCWS